MSHTVEFEVGRSLIRFLLLRQVWGFLGNGGFLMLAAMAFLIARLTLNMPIPDADKYCIVGFSAGLIVIPLVIAVLLLIAGFQKVQAVRGVSGSSSVRYEFSEEGITVINSLSVARLRWLYIQRVHTRGQCWLLEGIDGETLPLPAEVRTVRLESFILDQVNAAWAAIEPPVVDA